MNITQILTIVTPTFVSLLTGVTVLVKLIQSFKNKSKKLEEQYNELKSMIFRQKFDFSNERAELEKIVRRIEVRLREFKKNGKN